MKRIFNHSLFNKLFRENTRNNYYFAISPLILASKDTGETEAPFWTFIRRYRDVGAIATSMDLLRYMNTSTEIEITRDMLVGVSPTVNPNQLAKLFGARVYVEVQDETGSIVHPDGGKSLKALHPSGRTRMSWESLWQAFQDYGVDNLILDSELEAYEEANGYNVETEI